MIFKTSFEVKGVLLFFKCPRVVLSPDSHCSMNSVVAVFTLCRYGSKNRQWEWPFLQEKNIDISVKKVRCNGCRLTICVSLKNEQYV